MTNEAAYQYEIQRLTRELELRELQLHEYMGLERRNTALENQIHDLHSVIAAGEKKNLQLNQTIDKLNNSIKVMHDTIYNREDEIDRLKPLDKENEYLQRRVDSLEEAIEDMQGDFLKGKTRIWEILTGRVETGLLAYSQHANRACPYSPEIPETWEELFEMLRRYAYFGERRF